MPNWVMNSVEITGDPIKLGELAAAIDQQEHNDNGGVCTAVMPCPQELLDRKNEPYDIVPAWYRWRTLHWGTKWDFHPLDGYRFVTNDDGTATIEMDFDTAWAPPIQLYNHLVSQGFKVTADYFEPGMCFAGLYDNGDDETYQYSGNDAETVEEGVPKFLVDKYNIKEMLEDMEAEEGEEEEEDAE
ncbi:MAG: hypothetical protein LC650_02730 [Actinobacteria bacterium]|nr:hypothetical protein [Actinomycetota bacterium]